MGFNQVGLSALVLFAVGLSTAARTRLGTSQTSIGFQFGNTGQFAPQMAAGLSSQMTQSNPQTESSAAALLGLQLQSLSDDQGQQVLQRPAQNLTWRYPVAPTIPTPPAPVYFDWQSGPVPTQGVTATCNETAVYIEVSRDVLGSTFDISALTLGGCPARGMDASSQFFIYESPLYGCSSKLTVTANELVYIFTLGLASEPLTGTPILRNVGASVSIECHYLRFQNVSSSALMPAWIPYASSQAAEERLVFSLRLMMDDWSSESPSNQYYLGQLINIEASVLQFNHVPLRVLVDGCVATAVPEIDATPRYFFIENYGCLVDAKLTQSQSHFLPQTWASKLRFQLEAFKFPQLNSSSVYIACVLKATKASAPADAEHKACSFSDNGWTAAYGPDQVCDCCDSSCGLRKGRDLSDRDLELEKQLHLGPIEVKETIW